MTERIQTKPLSMDELLAVSESPAAGALIVFGGTVREQNEGRPVSGMEYTVYKPLAEKELTKLEKDTVARFDITSCHIRHRVGELKIGELSVLIVVRAAHRVAAYEASRYAIDTLKKTVPIWKRECYTDGTEVYVKGNPLHTEPKPI